jgi:hypothetical protein
VTRRLAPLRKSKRIARSELDNTWIACGGDDAEIRRSDIAEIRAVEIVELSVVERVEEFAAKFQILSFAPDKDLFGCGDVPICEPRPMKDIAAKTPKTSRPGG